MNKERLKELVNTNEIIVVDFWAPWCGPCKIMGPDYEEFKSEHPDVEIHKLNVEEATDVAAEYGVRNIPTVLYFKNGEIVTRTIGAQKLIDLNTKLVEVINAK